MKAHDNYLNPYLAGVLLGLVLLSSFVIAGRGIGASGAVNQVVVTHHAKVDSQHPYLPTFQPEKPLLEHWIVIEVLGLFIGALLSAHFAGRIKVGITRGAGVRRSKRLVLAALGGILMGFAARLARGCTSGQALSGGALLSVGSWVFMLALFAGAYLTILVVRRDWS